ncbi:MAG: TetR/AcrR family transcriptional regulator [Tateyamaria sp.]|uniref:TetR/AcrR family transcriptional regulator n=1 Tax=Tateyamaria sp. TaxID=1929288 RepID=UPI00329CF063
MFPNRDTIFNPSGVDVANTPQPDTHEETAPRRRRLSRDARKDEIVQAAVAQFSEAGFDGSTRDIALRAGITQPLLYRYFPSKEDLIEAVYEKVYLDRWNPAWDAALIDRSRPVKDRFQDFYEEYAQTIFDPEWLRIFSFAALRNAQIHDWYNHVVQEMILKPLVRERRVELGMPDTVLVSKDALEAPWLMHGSLLHYAKRRFILEIDGMSDTSDVISQALDMYLLLTQADAGQPCADS